jgi:Flp pilus assembly protein TadD
VTALTTDRHFSFASALPWAFLFGGFALYGAGASRGLAILDSGEFLGVAATLGVAHPTGYPLYALLGQLATLVPWGDKAFLINLVSAASGAGAAFFLALAASELGRQLELRPGARTAAVAAAGLLALTSRTLWSVSTLAEVYALNALFWGALLWAALRLRRTGAARELYLLALLGGLALANHATIALFLPAAAVIAWPGRRRARELLRALPAAAAFLLLGVSVNLYTPLRAAAETLFNWDDPSTLDTFYAHVAGAQYRGHFLYYGAGGARDALAQYGSSIWANVTPLGAFAAAALAWFFIKRYRGVALALLAYFVGYLAYCACYAIPDINYYFITLHLVVIFAAAIGVAAVVGAVGQRFPAARLAAAAGAALAVLAAGAGAFGFNFPYGHRRDFTFAESYGRRLLSVLPARAIFFASGDTNAFLSWYNVYVRGLRRDVAILSQIRLTSRGYLTAAARRDAYLAVPAEAEVRFFVENAVARGDVAEPGVLLSSDDFVLRNVIQRIIAGNAGRRPMFWGIGDPGGELKRFIIPYDVAMEIATADPPREELERRGEAAVAALTDLTAAVEEHCPAEVRDPVFRGVVDVYYVGLSNHLLDRIIVEPQEKLFKSYIYLFPYDAEGYKNLGGIYLLTGRAAEAADCYRRALDLAPGDAVARARLARALLAAGQADAAAAVAEGLGTDAGTEAAYVRGLVYLDQGKAAEALAAFDAAEADYAEDAEFWWEVGLAHDAAGHAGAAVEAFGEALALGPGFPRIYVARAANYLELGDVERARADFETAAMLNPGDGLANYCLARIYFGEGRPNEALAHLEAALRSEPGRFEEAAAGDAEFDRWRDSPAYKRLMAQFEDSGRTE